MKSKKWISLPLFLIVWGLMVLSLYKDAQILTYFTLALGCLWQLYLRSFDKKAAVFMLMVGLFGWSLESIESYYGLLKVMGEHPQPFWLILLWAYYVMVNFELFTDYVNRYWKAFLYGSTSLPGSYYLVSRFDIVEINGSLLKFFLINGTVGGLILMFSCLMYYSLKLDAL